MVDLPTWFNNVALISENGNTELFPALTKQLKGYKIQVNPEPAKAQYWLILINPVLTQQITGVAASTVPRQYQLTYSVDYVLRTHDGKDMRPPGHITLTRQITINNDRILGSNEETNLTLEEMRREIAIQIINRLATQ